VVAGGGRCMRPGHQLADPVVADPLEQPLGRASCRTSRCMPAVTGPHLPGHPAGIAAPPSPGNSLTGSQAQRDRILFSSGTGQDVERASPAEVAKAQEDGLLTDLGYAPRMRRYA